MDLEKQSCETARCIQCSVENCVYHEEDNSCVAGRIRVGGGCDACSTGETCCDTFEMK